MIGFLKDFFYFLLFIILGMVAIFGTILGVGYIVHLFVSDPQGVAAITCVILMALLLALINTLAKNDLP